MLLFEHYIPYTALFPLFGLWLASKFYFASAWPLQIRADLTTPAVIFLYLHVKQLAYWLFAFSRDDVWQFGADYIIFLADLQLIVIIEWKEIVLAIFIELQAVMRTSSNFNALSLKSNKVYHIAIAKWAKCVGESKATCTWKTIVSCYHFSHSNFKPYYLFARKSKLLAEQHVLFENSLQTEW